MIYNYYDHGDNSHMEKGEFLVTKKLKMSLLSIAFVFGLLFLAPNYVSAVVIDSEETLKQAFEEKNAIVEGTTITLTGDVVIDDIVDLCEKEYILNLNGHKLTAGEFYINDGSLTINDATGNGEIDTEYDFLMVSQEAELLLNNGKLDYLANEGKTTINNGAIDIITNYGTIYIEKGNFGPIWQRGNATINGGTFVANETNSAIDLDGKTTIINGGKFKKTDGQFALVINSGSSIDVNVIDNLLGDGYIAAYTGCGVTSESWYDEAIGETVYLYQAEYDSIEIIKDETEMIFNKIAPNGIWTINGAKPKDMEESDFLLSSIANDVELPKGYSAVAWCEPADEFDPEVVSIYISYNGAGLKGKTVKAVYNEPSKLVTTKVDAVLDKIAEKTGENLTVDTGFRLEDLYLINYLNTSTKGINGSLALNFSKDLIKLTNGGNISYKYDYRLGNSTPTGLWNFTGGRVIVYYDKIAVGTTRIGLTTNHVLYVPNSTANTDEARIAAALKRIEDYLGTTKGITIVVGGTLESLNKDGCTWNDYGLIDATTCGENYYNITVNGETYKFAICKKEENKLETPKYIGSNLTSNVVITSEVTTIPLDTAITVNEVKNDTIKKALGTSDYTAYDISLYSNTKQQKITKLTNGKFEVSIPVPTNLMDKQIAVYYVADDGKKEEHIATIEDNIASFETNHFSTYVITEKQVATKPEKDETPNTGLRNSIGIVYIVATASFVAYIVLKNRKTEEN